MPGTSTEQVVDKGIRQKSIHSFHSIYSFPDGSAFCPGAPKRVPSDSEKHRRVYTSSNVCHSHEWRVDTASGMTLKKQNACLHAVRHAVEKKIACIHGLRSEGVKLPRGYNLDLHVYMCTCIHYSKELKEHVDIMIFIECYPLKRCQGCVKLIASKVNCFLNINDLSEVQLCMSSNSWT